MLPRPPHTCSSSTLMACSSMTERSTTEPPLTRAMLPRQPTTSHRRCRKQWRASRSVPRRPDPTDVPSSMLIESSPGHTPASGYKYGTVIEWAYLLGQSPSLFLPSFLSRLARTGGRQARAQQRLLELTDSKIEN